MECLVTTLVYLRFPCWYLVVIGIHASCVAWWAARWAQSAHKSCGCERDGGLHRDLNVTALGVAFLLPLFGGRRLYGYRLSLAGRSADVGLGKAMVT
ncbi:hypothetical protein Taro_009847 [Colocasia esculenta]|uniref:Uncharacterized protein n=1 Tax=Colocasia esculenta TaxID=4460 RepID=A0A843UB77_COLES|nr:hypothetical protein [Colocasia esculenta]